jgi:antitoxin component YwqK of YwqJK toxin-antitoxin module
MIEEIGQNVTKQEIKRLFSNNPWGAGYFVSGKYGKGLFIKWYHNGNVEEKVNYKDGKIDGVRELYTENGVLYQSRTYKDDKKDGELNRWYEDGTLLETSFFKNDKPHGEHKTYHENGQICIHAWYKNGEYCGEFAKFDEQGNCIDHREYFDEPDEKGRMSIALPTLSFNYTGKLKHDKELEC